MASKKVLPFLLTRSAGHYAQTDVLVFVKIIWKWKYSAWSILSKITWSDFDKGRTPLGWFGGNSPTWKTAGCIDRLWVVFVINEGYLRQYNFIYFWLAEALLEGIDSWYSLVLKILYWWSTVNRSLVVLCSTQFRKANFIATTNVLDRITLPY